MEERIRKFEIICGREEADIIRRDYASLREAIDEEKARQIILRKMKSKASRVLAEREKGPAFRRAVELLMKYGTHLGHQEVFEQWPESDFDGFWEAINDENMFGSGFGSSYGLGDFDIVWMMSLTSVGLHLHLRSGGTIRFSKKQVRAAMEEAWTKEKQGVQTLF